MVIVALFIFSLLVRTLAIQLFTYSRMISSNREIDCRKFGWKLAYTKVWDRHTGAPGNSTAFWCMKKCVKSV